MRNERSRFEDPSYRGIEIFADSICHVRRTRIARRFILTATEDAVVTKDPVATPKIHRFGGAAWVSYFLGSGVGDAGRGIACGDWTATSSVDTTRVVPNICVISEQSSL